jgi:heme/copper-type cytochrome/quinol oxidase subunit 3
MTTTTTSHEESFRAGTSLGLDHRKLGMWLFLASEVMFFGGLITAFLHTKLRYSAPTLSFESIVLVGLNTFVLVTSSFMVAQALDAAHHGRRGHLKLYLGLTALLGAVFLAGQAYEFSSLYADGVTLTGSQYGSAFYTLTGTHGLHVLIGVVWALAVLLGTLRHGSEEPPALRVEIFGLYWHFVDIVWLVLFTIIYLV